MTLQTKMYVCLVCNSYTNTPSGGTKNIQMCKLNFKRAEEPEIKLPTLTGSLEKQESSRKTSISALLTMPKPLTVWITQTGKFLKR